MNDKVDNYFSKQKSPQREICNYLRVLINQTIPGTKEEMKWGVPTFAEGKFYIVSLKDSVNLGFSVSGLNSAEMALFEGKGKTMRHIKINALQDIDKEELVKLIKLVDEKALCKPC